LQRSAHFQWKPDLPIPFPDQGVSLENLCFLRFSDLHLDYSVLVAPLDDRSLGIGGFGMIRFVKTAMSSGVSRVMDANGQGKSKVLNALLRFLSGCTE